MIVKKIINKIFKDGYCIVDNVLKEKECSKYIKGIKIIQERAKKDPNFENKSFNNGQEIYRNIILQEPDFFLNIINKIIIMNVLKRIFQDTFILDNVCASNSVHVDTKYSALVHIDSHLSCNIDNNTSDVVVLFCLSDFSRENGATKIWPRRHKSGISIQNSKEYKKLIKKKNIFAEAKMSSAIFLLGHTWHQIGKNSSKKDRWGILCHYKRWWAKPAIDHTKCGSYIYSKLNFVQKKLFGFNSIPPRFDLKKKVASQLKTLRNSSVLKKKYAEINQF